MNAENNAPLTWGKLKYTLLFPVSIPNHPTITEIVFSEPNGEALELIDALGIEDGKDPTVTQALGLLRALSGQPKAVTDKMHMRDIAGASKAISPLLEGVA